MVDIRSGGDVFDTSTVPKQDSAAHQAVVMPSEEHALEPQKKELDRLFWAAIIAEEEKK